MKLAMFLNVAAQLESMYAQNIRPAIAIILILGLVAGVLYNLPKVMGDDRNGKEFWFGVGKFMIGAAILPILIEAIRSFV